MRRLIIIPILVVLSTILIVFIYFRQQSNELPSNVIYSSGTVESGTVAVSAQTTGKIIEKRFARGALVRVGDTLALIESDLLKSRDHELESGLATTEDELAAARIDLANAHKNLDRLRKAFEAGSISKRAFEDAQTAVDAGSKRVAAIESRLQTIAAQRQTVAVQLRYVAVVSPIDGFVQADPLEVGELATTGSVMFELVDLAETWVEIYVNETDLPRIQLNDSAEVILDSAPSQPLRGIVSFISQKAEFTPKNVQTRKERTKLVFAVRVRVDNSSGQFKPGLPVDVYLKKS